MQALAAFQSNLALIGQALLTMMDASMLLHVHVNT